MDAEFEQQKILNISISKKTKFFSILYSDYNLEIYNLTEEKRVNENCNCMTQILEAEFMVGYLNGSSTVSIVESEINTNNESKTNSSKPGGFFSFALGKIKGIIFEKSRKSFSKYKFHPPDNFDDDLYQNHYLENVNSISSFHLNPISHVEPQTLVLFERINEIVRFYFMFILL